MSAEKAFLKLFILKLMLALGGKLPFSLVTAHKTGTETEILHWYNSYDIVISFKDVSKVSFITLRKKQKKNH